MAPSLMTAADLLAGVNPAARGDEAIHLLAAFHTVAERAQAEAGLARLSRRRHEADALDGVALAAAGAAMHFRENLKRAPVPSR